MINALITYLPFYRINEIEEYFMINVNKIRALRNVVYVDNVFNEYQKNSKKSLSKIRD
jgi:Uma2 family endonuclease